MPVWIAVTTASRNDAAPLASVIVPLMLPLPCPNARVEKPMAKTHRITSNAPSARKNFSWCTASLSDAAFVRVVPPVFGKREPFKLADVEQKWFVRKATNVRLDRDRP